MPDYPQSMPLKSKKPRKYGVFHWSLLREFASTGLLVSSILLGIVVLTQLIRLLGESVSGLLAVDGVLAMLGFSALNYLPVLLSISLFLSVLLTLTRSYRDSEMVVWFTSGIGLTRWIRPVMWYALPMVGLIALFSLVLTPWALTMADEYKRRLESRDDVSSATPGTFRESKQADRVFFLEEMDASHKRVANIFVRSKQNGREGTMVAREGYQETAPNGDRFLVLLNGMRYEGLPGQADYRIVEFERYAMRIEPAELRQAVPSQRSYPTAELIRNPTTWNVAELEWRIGLPLSALILTLLAIPLSFVNPRAGRSLNLIVAMVLFMFYNNMISVTNSWVGQGKMNAATGLLGIHAFMFVVMLLMFFHRSGVNPWRRWRR
ncbi:MAG: LPS export ABC transporter permease LptF [Gammaproteobacteria bacterium]|nr:LPS export ABC transporter permease LptF [Gammaproteobacteria bacterium]MBU1969528.1 LPS export ABC transporter permease LptF [Gammaproteobacteria bacterium]